MRGEIGFKGETFQGLSDICAFEVVEETDDIVLIIDFFVVLFKYFFLNIKSQLKEYNKNNFLNVKKGCVFLFTFFLLFLFDNSIHARFVEASKIEVEPNTKTMPPQPTLIVGNIESLTTLAEANYLDGKPVLLFLDTNMSRDTSSLPKSLPFYSFLSKGFMDLALESFPETGTVTTSTPLEQSAKYRFAMGKKPLVLDILQDGNYKVFAKFKKEMQSDLAIVTVDTEVLTPSTDISFTREDITNWQCFADTYLNKGRHLITVNPSIEELIIVPLDVFQNYIEYAKNILQKNRYLIFLLMTKKEKRLLNQP